MSEKAIFAAGCFWGVEAGFLQVPGVLDVTSGYTGGKTENPSYREVCGHGTGHAEAVEVTFDPEKVSYDALVAYFWRMHDPTQVNRQGPDIGSQYRSAIFVLSPEQRRIAEASKDAAQASFAKPIATEIVDATKFWPAEAYHQRYFERNAIACHVPAP
ncbi:MAG TPA: peptide-methionine (S)-S-oxide reductase MsrA [Candidatus Dormibacteraeota bacterium]|nr:peptide-methionine (S)-S-oxide reductase MsrA [Candidatus Dormibacteraeota bacterium]